jgi:predicted amidohydrolase
MKAKITSLQYEFDKFSDWKGFEKKINALLEACAHQKSQLVLFPEYFFLELASLFPFPTYSSLQQLEKLQDFFPDILSLFQSLSKKLHLYICAGTFPEKVKDSYKNRSYFFSPHGKIEFQDKLQLTSYEKEAEVLTSGKEIKVFNTSLGVVGIAICYDVEFPLLVRKQVEAGANLILVPSCTDCKEGFNRVHLSSRARAIENQCYVAHSALLGYASWCEAVDVNVGKSAIYTPCDLGFPPDGILAQGTWNERENIHGEIDFKLIENVRKAGQVRNHHDWEHLQPLLTHKVRSTELF